MLSHNQQKVLRNLSLIPIGEIRNNKVSNPSPDTLQWIFDDKFFTLWRYSPSASVLGINESPGQDKSVLARFVTEHLEDCSKSCAVIYFFCCKQEQNFSHATDILRALIIQLIDS